MSITLPAPLAIPAPSAAPAAESIPLAPTGTTVGPHRTAVATSKAQLWGHAAALATEGFRLALVGAHDDGDAYRVVYLYTNSGPDRRTELHLRVDHDDPSVPTLAALSFSASRFEREMRDLFGIVPTGHPLPRRLVRHAQWPEGWYPMRDDAGDPPAFGPADKPFPFLTVEGPGVYEIPVGPVHAGLIEPGHFRFSVVGETILKLKARLWYVHKGLEKLFSGRTPQAALPLAERISGDTAVGHTLAFCRAVEEALGVEVPAEADRMRAVLLELERLYNHITDIGALCNDVGHGILNSHAQRVRETLLRLNASVTGHRLLRGGVLLGGATIRRLPDPADLARIGADISEIVDLALSNSLVAERFTGTAVLTAGQARDLGAVGYVARASGLPMDARLDHPGNGLDGCDIDLTTLLASSHQRGGDVLARFQQRAVEMASSIALIQVLLPTVHEGTVCADLARLGDAGEITTASAPASQPGLSRRSGVGIVEGWRGTIVHRVEVDGAGRLTRVKIVDPSFLNWPALPVALTNTIVPDFPLANKSFNLSYAGNDL